MSYATREDVDNVYGAVNIKDWADINATDDPVEIASRITWSLDKAERYINARLERRNFAMPFNPVPGIVQDATAELAGYYLYSARMLDDGDRTRNNLSHMMKSAHATINMIVSGDIKLEVTMQDNTDAPFIAKG